MNILIKFPTRNRPDRFFETLDLYYNMADDITKIRFLVSLDVDDLTMNNSDILYKLSKYDNLSYFIDDNKSKVEAINSNMINQEFDILLLASDDMIPVVSGYDNIIRKDMMENFNQRAGALWYNDGHQGMRLNTLCIMNKEYYDTYGYIYYPEYKSLYCDNEYTIVGISNNNLKYIDNMIIAHNHPDSNPNVELDELYIRNNNLLNYDREIFIKRQQHNFINNEKWSFGITTSEIVLNSDGSLNENFNHKIFEIIKSIENMNIPKNKFEIILIGHNNLFRDIEKDNLRIIFFDETLKNKWITRKKNILFDTAKFENCVIIHDYISFDIDWYKGFLKFENNWNVAMCQLRTKGDIRWRDWVLGWDQSAPYLLEHKGIILHKNRLLYSDTDYIHTNMYISGSVIIGKTDYLRSNKLNEDLTDGMWTFENEYQKGFFLEFKRDGN
jgi:hypothetical protein